MQDVALKQTIIEKDKEILELTESLSEAKLRIQHFNNESIQGLRMRLCVLIHACSMCIMLLKSLT